MGTQASRLRVLKYLHIHIRFALIELTQAGRLRSRSYFDHSKISIKRGNTETGYKFNSPTVPVVYLLLPLLPPKIDPRTPRIICLPSELPIDRAALVAKAPRMLLASFATGDGFEFSVVS